ncbi:hypothetical protein [Sphingomonas sp. CCH16-B10]|jgi:hypothetical protein|uniref:hypothetical protein n=1 Tax=Sphingomonas sp. CCH16-B10 TaxID=1768755 RepID=UPI0008325428|nr:hypothetical protein [Sphingomonas sp. CCH16-B10]
MDLSALSPPELLNFHARISEELRQRGIVRSSNNPVGDLAEYLFCRAFGWTQAANSARSADAACADGKLYQIKGRRTTRHNNSRQLGALRGLSDGGFDFLAAVIFAENYTVSRAAIIPHATVLANAKYYEWTKSWRFLLRDTAWEWPDVVDVTENLRRVSF